MRTQSLVRASSKMAGRGRGRGRGRGFSFDVGMIGFQRGEALPAAIQQPPPLYPVGESLCCCLFSFKIALIVVSLHWVVCRNDQK